MQWQRGANAMPTPEQLRDLQRQGEIARLNRNKGEVVHNRKPANITRKDIRHRMHRRLSNAILRMEVAKRTYTWE